MVSFVTGAPGWLGDKLVEGLRKKDESVRCLVLPGFKTDGLKGMGADTVEGDVTEPKTLEGKMKGIETVYHCAGIIHPKLMHSSDFYKINRDGTKNMLEAAVSAGVKRFVYVSSNSAAGVNVSRDRLMREEDTPRPYTDYGKSKYMAEQIVKGFQQGGKIETVIVRPCWFYGPRQPQRMTKLMQMIKKGKPLMFGDGKNLRSMSYIDNLVDGLLLAGSSKNAVGQTYWIADKKPYSTIEIYGTIADILGVKMTPKYVPAFVSNALELGDKILGYAGVYEINMHVGGEMIRDIAVTIEKAEKELGYRPKVGLREGMERSVEWCKKNNLL